MSLMDAPAYDPTADNRRRNILIGAAILLVLLLLLTFAGYVLGHGWLWTNLGYEHRVNNFFTALEAKDYSKAYGIYYADPDWQQHPGKYSDYPLARFTEDWTSASPVNAPITSHHVDISRTDGSGAFGTGVIVAVRVNLDNGGGHKVFMYVNKADKTMTWPAPHELEYNPSRNFGTSLYCPAPRTGESSPPRRSLWPPSSHGSAATPTRLWGHRRWKTPPDGEVNIYRQGKTAGFHISTP